MKPLRFLRWLAVVAGLLAAGFAGLSAVLVWFGTHPPRRAVEPLPADFPFAAENVSFAATDGVKLAGWFLPVPGATRAVVLLHGNGGNRRQMLTRAQFLRSEGHAVLLYDARGHGESAGSLVSFGWFERQDLLGALDFLRDRGLREFGLIGMSQGAATIALAAPQLRDVHWAVLEQPYPTLRTIVYRDARHHLHVPGRLGGALAPALLRWQLGMDIDVIAPRDTITGLHCPVLLMAGGDDPRAPPDDVREIFDHANAPRFFRIVPGQGHVSLYDRARADYEAWLREFLAAARKPAPR